MFNPFHPFTPAFLEKFVQSNKTFFTRQLFPRGLDHFDHNIKASFLFTQHDNRPSAEQHLGAIKNDPTVRIYDYSLEEDKAKLILAASQPPGYKIFCNVFYDQWKDHLTDPLKMKVKKYIDTALHWKPGGSEQVDFTIFVHYGEVYARLKLRKQEARVQLETIEKILI